jgi:hypothetical protein
MNTTIFDSPSAFAAAFEQGLVDMLAHEGLGVFILVCANAGFEPQLQQALAPALKTRFERHAAAYREALRSGRTLPDADDDVMVFLKMMAVGFEALAPTERRLAGPWEVQFNALRSFRPPRMAHQKVEAIHQPFNENGFHFNKPFLRKECFWSGELAGREVELLYNKFPFVDSHGLLVPQREHNAPQFLTQDDHRYLWRLCEQLGERLPGVGFGYNAYGAYSSVNHLHFQMYRRDNPLPVESHGWRHNGGNQEYPATCRRFDAMEEAWRFIESLHAKACSYNLLYVPGALYCLPRRLQGSYRHSEWTGGFAWYEMCGGVVTFNRGHYESLDEATIREEFARLAWQG